MSNGLAAKIQYAVSAEVQVSNPGTPFAKSKGVEAGLTRSSTTIACGSFGTTG